MIQTDGAIGVMDSGVGGVSVLRALRFALPQENFIYFSDRANAPYGIKPPEIIKKWVGECAELLTECGIKALVIACNTATSVAVEEMRRRYGEMPVVGLEPAVRPAVRYAMGNGGDVLVLATGVTLGQERFKGLCRCISK
ncbi:MAG: aspartate/glutamate racemase family protein, partial [Clostridia bacterium]|nr:aspartate/glutamate racemase family protein [Clostridia bacterium]